MKIGILSDLHLSGDPLQLHQWPWDVLVLAGDLGRPERAMTWARQAPCPTILVAGNHEYYGSDLSTAVATLKTLALGSNVTVLEKESVRMGGIRFLGCTLWSDYRPTPDNSHPMDSVALITEEIRDFSAIRVSSEFPDALTPAVCRLLFDQTVEWLEREFLSDPLVPTVVVSHFAPSTGSIHPSYQGSMLNPAFVSDLGEHISRWQPQLWIHGHTHNSFDYEIGRTRVICNPRGYAIGKRIENTRFNPTLTINV